jgi:4-hydroxybenzoate polyprenyltransferase
VTVRSTNRESGHPLAWAERVGAFVRLARPHQWVKNLLLLLPGLAAHLPWTPQLGVTVLRGFLAFSVLGSTGYVLNDIRDVERDRVHRTKRLRPLASSMISPGEAAAFAVALGLVGAFLAVGLPPRFLGLSAAYVAGSALYSIVLRRRLLADVIALAALYTLRVIAGGALVGVTLSQWFLPFSVFLFLSLALVKRVTELAQLPDAAAPRVSGRAYRPGDEHALSAFGIATSASAALIYCLYVTSHDVSHLYRRPAVLWAGLPLLLYWQARMWIFALRGDLDDDPVVFTLRDRVSFLVCGAFLGIVWLAT